MRNKLGGFFLVVVLSAALLGGWLGDRVRAEGPADDIDPLVAAFTEVFHKVSSQYAVEVEPRQLVEDAVRGMLRTLDPHSSFFAARDYSKLQEEQKGQYFGLGISIRPEVPGSGRVQVVQPPTAGTPAYRSGIRSGDVIAKVEGEPIDEWTMDEVISKLKGPKGTKVNITLDRPGVSEPITMDVERDAIPIYTIRYAFHVKPGIGYIRIDRFAESTGEELNRALEKLDEENLKGLVLDLRNNPGGALSQAISVSDRFLKRGQMIVGTRDRYGRERSYQAPRGTRDSYPMIVLINRFSASASEIVSGALQDHDRALIVGETSYGKALVQTVYPLRGNRGLALTTGKYYTPSGRLIQRPYQEGFYDYLYAYRGDQDDSQQHSTDAGRKVFGGGGIAPDYKVEGDLYKPLAARVNRRSLFYKFAGMLTRGAVQTPIDFSYDHKEVAQWPEEKRQKLMAQLRIPEQGQVMDRFVEFLRDEGLDFNGEQLEESRNQLNNRLQQEVVSNIFGDAASVLVRLEIDSQAKTAIDLLPKAKDLIAGKRDSGK